MTIYTGENDTYAIKLSGTVPHPLTNQIWLTHETPEVSQANE